MQARVGAWRRRRVPGAQAVVVTPTPSRPRARCHQVLSPGGGRGMEGWRTPASGWSPDDAPRVCLLFPGCLHLLPPLALLANLSSHKEPLPVWNKLSINCSVKPPGRLSSAVIEGFPPPGLGAAPVQKHPSLSGGGREASVQSPGHPCVHPAPAGSQALSHEPPSRLPGDSAPCADCGKQSCPEPCRRSLEGPRCVFLVWGLPWLHRRAAGREWRGGKEPGPHGPLCWRTAWMLPAAFPHTPALVFLLVWPSF